MTIAIIALVRVVENEIHFHSPEITVVDQVQHKAKEDLVPIDRGMQDWLFIKLNDHDTAVNYASILVRFLLRDGWKHSEDNQYVDGNKFTKIIR